MPQNVHPTGADLLVHGTYVLRRALDRLAHLRPAPLVRPDGRRPIVTTGDGRSALERPRDRQ